MTATATVRLFYDGHEKDGVASVDWAGEDDVRQHLLAVYIDKALAFLRRSRSDCVGFWNVVEEALDLLLAELADESKPRFNSLFGVVPLMQGRTGEPGWREIRIVPGVCRKRLGAKTDFTGYYAFNAHAWGTGFWPLLDWMLTVTDLDKESMRPVLANLDHQRSWYSENGFPRHEQSGIAPYWAAMKGGMTLEDFRALPRASERDLVRGPTETRSGFLE